MEVVEGSGRLVPLRLPGHPHRVQVSGVQKLTKLILTGYRPALGYVGCLRSILRIHNETVNIWYVSKLKTTKTIEIITL